MEEIPFSEIRLMVANSAAEKNIIEPNEKSIENSQKYYSIRISLIRTLKTYIKKYYQSPDKYNVLYLSIAYMDIILSKNKISLSHDKNLKYLCLCCFLLSLKFLGNFNCSKKIISNFCKNYKKEYKIFEIQCLILLDYNLSYTTVYDYLNLIAIKEDKRFLCLCNYYLYQICEEKDYISYPPFYVSIAIFQLVKNNTNNIKRNHYDKYFKDDRVKILTRKLKDIINPSIINDLLNIVYNDIDNINNNNSMKIIKNQNINFFTNNNIQNNIFIINNNNIGSNLCFENNKNTEFNTPIKIVKTKTNKNNDNFSEKNKLNFLSKSSNFISNSSKGQNRLTDYNLNYNLLGRISLKQNKINPNNKIISYKKSNKNEISCKTLYINNPTNDKLCYKNSTIQIKKYILNNKRMNMYNNSTVFLNKSKTYIFGKKNDVEEDEKRHILNNKSSLNFQLVSGVSKEKLLKLSRNLSKSIINSSCDIVK